MHNDKIDMYLITNSRFFPTERMPIIQERLKNLPDEKFVLLHSLQLKDPSNMLLVSIFLGEFGVDRFMLGDVGIGIGKLLTFGGCLVWWLIDLFLIKGRTREVNFSNLMRLLDVSTPISYGRPMGHDMHHGQHNNSNDRLQ